MLRTQSVRPHPALQPFVHSFVQRGMLPDSSESIEPVVARLGVMLNFKFAGMYKIRSYLGNTFVRPNPASIVGPQTFRRVDITLSGNVDTLAVMFQPCGFHALFGIPTDSVADVSFEGRAVIGSAISQLYERLGQLRTFSERIALLNSYFFNRFKKVRAVPPVYNALQQITLDPHYPISKAARQAGLSLRQFERKSLVYAGVAPKTFARIARFNKALQLSRSSSLSWSEIAQDTDYYDQMHLIRDFRAFTGRAPGLARQEIASDHLINFSCSYSAGSHESGSAHGTVFDR